MSRHEVSWITCDQCGKKEEHRADAQHGFGLNLEFPHWLQLSHKSPGGFGYAVVEKDFCGPECLKKYLDSPEPDRDGGYCVSCGERGHRPAGELLDTCGWYLSPDNPPPALLCPGCYNKYVNVSDLHNAMMEYVVEKTLPDTANEKCVHGYPIGGCCRIPKSAVDSAGPSVSVNVELTSMPVAGSCSMCGGPVYDTPSGNCCPKCGGGVPLG